jgi:hypothetical protein
VPVSSTNPINFSGIADAMRKTVAFWYNAQIEIVDPNTGNLAWDIETNSYAGDAATLIWSGKARIQPLKRSSYPNGDIYDPSMRSLVVQIPYDNTDDYIRSGMSIRIVGGGENVFLEELELSIDSVINSSYGWNTTIYCSVDTKSISDTIGS